MSAESWEWWEQLSPECCRLVFSPPPAAPPPSPQLSRYYLLGITVGVRWQLPDKMCRECPRPALLQGSLRPGGSDCSWQVLQGRESKLLPPPAPSLLLSQARLEGQEETGGRTGAGWGGGRNRLASSSGSSREAEPRPGLRRADAGPSWGRSSALKPPTPKAPSAWGASPPRLSWPRNPQIHSLHPAHKDSGRPSPSTRHSGKLPQAPPWQVPPACLLLLALPGLEK